VITPTSAVLVKLFVRRTEDTKKHLLMIQQGAKKDEASYKKPKTPRVTIVSEVGLTPPVLEIRQSLRMSVQRLVY